MNLRDLSTASMLAITGQLLEKTRAHHAHASAPSPREVLLAHPKLAPHVPDLDAAHAALLGTTAAPADGTSAALAALSTQEETVDLAHDQALRNGFALLTLAAMVAGVGTTPEPSLVELRDTLYPEGGVAVNDSYIAESGSALAQEKRMTPALSKRLGHISITVEGKQTSLAELVEAQISNGKQLGKLEAQKRKLQPTPTVADDDGEPVVNAVNAARIGWVQGMQLLVQLVRRTTLTEAERESLLGRLTAEVSKHATHAAKGAATGSAPAAPASGATPGKS